MRFKDVHVFVKERGFVFQYTTIETMFRFLQYCTLFSQSRENNLINLIRRVIDSLGNVMVMKVYSQ